MVSLRNKLQCIYLRTSLLLLTTIETKEQRDIYIINTSHYDYLKFSNQPWKSNKKYYHPLTPNGRQENYSYS